MRTRMFHFDTQDVQHMTPEKALLSRVYELRARRGERIFDSERLAEGLPIDDCDEVSVIFEGKTVVRLSQAPHRFTIR